MLYDLWKNELLCDVLVRGLDSLQPVRCHAIVLASSSTYFKALLCGAGADMRDSSPSYQVPLEHADISLALGAIYSQTIDFEPKKLDTWLRIASYLGIQSLLDRLGEEMVQSMLSIQTAVHLLSLASKYDLPVKSNLMRFVQVKLGLILNQEDQLKPMRAEEEEGEEEEEEEEEGSFSILGPLHSQDLKELLSSDELVIEECDVLQAVLDWCVHHRNQGNCGTSLDDLLSDHLHLVRDDGLAATTGEPTSLLMLLKPKTPSHVEALVSLANILRSVGSDNIAHPDQGHRDQGRSGGALTRGRRRQGTSSMLLAAGGHDCDWRSLKSCEYYDPLEDRWRTGPSLTQSASFASCAVLLKEAYFVGGTPLSTIVLKHVPRGEERQSLDLPRGGRASTSHSPSSSPPMNSSYLLGSHRGNSSCQWEPCANLTVPRAHSGVVASPDALFVIGGRGQTTLSTCEVYRASQDSWLPTSWQTLDELKTERSALAAAFLRGSIFAIGGQSNNRALASMEIFDLGSEQWLPCTQKLALGCRKYAAAATLNGRIFLVGGVDEKRMRLSSIEAYDPREGVWRHEANMASPRSSCGVAVLGDKLYIVGGQASDSDMGGSVGSFSGMGVGGGAVHSSTECFDRGGIRQCAQLSVGRSGLGLCSL